MEQEQTKVMFRKWKDNGQIDAIMPELPGTNDPATMTCYAHIGQHSTGDSTWYLDTTVPATPSEYSDLKAELESIGYNVKVIKRMPSNARQVREAALGIKRDTFEGFYWGHRRKFWQRGSKC